MKDKIIINDLEIFAYHGVLNEEKSLGQRFLLSIELELDLKKAGIHDSLSDTVDYGKLCHEVENVFTKTSFDLIEKVAHEVCTFILSKYKLVSSVKIEVKKPWAPIGKPLKYASIVLFRKWHTAYIAMGSNVGDKQKNINDAIEYLGNQKHTHVVSISSMYETEPVGYLEQDNFINGAVKVLTYLEPKELMCFLLDIEKTLKRERSVKWGPRTLDLDILLYDNLISSDESIILPHPRMHEREFVLKPLNDIAPYAIHPLLNKRVFELLTDLDKH